MRYSPKCHAHFKVGAVTTIVTDGKAYFTVGVPPEENPAFNSVLLQKYHLTHIDMEKEFNMHKFTYVDIFVENDPMVKLF